MKQYVCYFCTALEPTPQYQHGAVLTLSCLASSPCWLGWLVVKRQASRQTRVRTTEVYAGASESSALALALESGRGLVLPPCGPRCG